MRKFGFIGLIGFTFYLGLILFANRAAFRSRFDTAYWKDRFEHSQWSLPASPRTIGDDGLYLYAGYRLTLGDSPAAINAEMPPLGKYLIGISVRIFGNGSWFGFFTTTGSLVVFFFLAKKILNNTFLALCATVLFATDPLFINQFPLTMLDSIQLFFLLLTLFFLVTNGSPIALGISLGLFSSVKTPILYAPILAMIIVVFLRKPKKMLICLALAATTYILSYFRFFLLGHTMVDWINLQKWMVGFYRSSLLAPNTGAAISTLFFGRMQNLFSHAWESSGIWSPIWPIITMFGIGSIIKIHKNHALLPLVILSFLFLAIFTVIPFWTRYLLLLLPFLYILSLAVLSSVKQAIVVIIVIGFLVVNLSSSIDILFPTPQATVADFTYSWEHGFFGDMYEHLASASKTTDRQSFHRFGLKTFSDGQIEAANIDVRSPHWSRFQSPQSINVRITYFTRELGPFTETRTFPVLSENGTWVIPWQWEYLFDGFTQHSRLETTVIPARRGSIIDSKRNLLAWDVPGFMIDIVPDKVSATQEDAMLADLERAFHRYPGAVTIHERYVGNVLPDVPIPIGVLTTAPKLYPGMTITPHLVRVSSQSGIIANTAYKECCSFLYSTTNYDGISGPEQQYNTTLKGINGGKLVIEDKHGNVVRAILNLPKQEGQDVVIQ